MTSSTNETFTVSLPNDREVLMTRMFNAPPSLVFDAFIRPEHLKRWWGMRGSTLVVCDVDARVGGAWRFVSKASDGLDYAFRGEYREVAPPDRLVYTFEFEGMPGHVAIETLTFEATDGGTRMLDSMLFDSQEDRDGFLQSGMEEGARQTMDRLAELLAELTA